MHNTKLYAGYGRVVSALHLLGMVAVIMLAACSTCWPSRALDHPVLQRLFGRVRAASAR